MKLSVMVIEKQVSVIIITRWDGILKKHQIDSDLCTESRRLGNLLMKSLMYY